MSAETDKLVGAAASQALPSLFKEGFQRRYPSFIGTQGRGNGYYNAMYEMEQRQFNAARATATAADAEQASRTIVGMFLTAAKMSGRELSDEQIVKIQESARFHGANIETYIGIARGLGLTENAINYIRQAFYGDKGSTAHMFDTAYNTLKSKVGSGAALRQAQQLASYQFGAGWNRAMTGGLNADEYAATQQFMIENGGMAGSDLSSSQGYALIDTRKMDSYISAHRGEKIGDMVMGSYDEAFLSGPDAQRNNQALKMASNNYINELKKMNYDQLRKSMKGRVAGEVDSAWGKLHDLDEQMKKIKADYRLKINTQEKDVNKAKKDLQKQLKENIKKAKKANDDEAVKELEEYGKKIVDGVEDLYKSGVKNAKGEEVSVFEVDRQARNKVADIAHKQVSDLSQEYFQKEMGIKSRKSALSQLILKGKEDTKEARDLRADIAKLEKEKAELRDNAVYKHVKPLYGNSDKDQRTQAVGNLAKELQAAMAASGKPISVQEALQASKSLVPLSAGTADLRAMSEHLATKIGGVIDRNGSPEQFLLQMASGRNIAQQYGLRGLEANLVAGLGVNANKYGAQFGMTDQASKDLADEITKEGAQNSRTARQGAILHMLAGKSGKNNFFQNLRAKVDEGKITQEQFDAVYDIAGRMEQDPTSLTEKDGSRVEAILKKADMVNAKAFEADSALSKKAVRDSKDVYEKILTKTAKNRVLDTSKTTQAARVHFKTDQDTAKNINQFILKNSKEFQNILEETDYGDDQNTKYMNLLEEKHSTGELDDKTYETLKKDAQEHGTEKMLNVWDSEYSDSEKLNKQKAKLETYDQMQRDNELEQIAAQGKKLFSGTDKNGFSKLIDIVGSEEYKNADSKGKTNMISEAFGTTLTRKQQEFLAYQMVRTGKLSAGMQYTTREGEEGYLSEDQINVAQYAMQHPAELKSKIEAAGPDGMITIGDEKYTMDQINEYVADVENAAGNAVGMNENMGDRGKFFAKNEKGEYESTNAFSQMSKSGYFTDVDVDTARRQQIMSKVATMSNLVLHGGVQNTRYNALKDAYENGGNMGDELNAIVDAIMKDPDKAEEYGVGDQKQLNELKRRAAWNAKEKERVANSWNPFAKAELYDLNNLDQELFSRDTEGQEAKKKEEEERDRKIDDKFLAGQETTNEILGEIRDNLKSA